MNQDYFWLALSIAVLAGAAVLWVLKRRKLQRARTWPKAAGQVDSAVLRLEQTGTTSSRWAAVVQYSYSVQGVTYSGRLRHTSLLKKSVEKWIGNYKTGIPLTIRYNPGKPKDSVLFENEQGWGEAV
jgi:Protein of unknown function (DUF3592)